MDFDMESARYQQAERRGTGFYDMASLFSHRGEASLVFHGFFVLPASHIINPAPPIPQRELDIDSFADRGPGENFAFEDPSGSRAAPSNKDYGTDHEPMQYGALNANFEFNFDVPSRIEAGQGQGQMSQTPITNPFTDDFPPTHPNEIFGNGMPGQEYNFPHSMEIPNVPSTMPETHTSYNDYDQPTHHNPYSLNIPRQENTLSSCLETNFYEPSFSQETSFSATSTSASNGFYENYNQSDIFAGPEQGLSSKFENPPENQTTQLPTTSTPSIPALHTSPPSNSASPPPASSPISISPDRHTCPHCPRTFKRLGDVKRHEKVHIPGQRRFHCGKAGCERRGWRGFYRRDKLRDHVKTVHGS